jgi:lipoprotein
MKNIILRINLILLFFFVIACQSGQEKKEMKKENKCLFRSGDDLTAFYIQNPKQKEIFRKVLSLLRETLFDKLVELKIITPTTDTETEELYTIEDLKKDWRDYGYAIDSLRIDSLKITALSADSKCRGMIEVKEPNVYVNRETGWAPIYYIYDNLFWEGTDDLERDYGDEHGNYQILLNYEIKNDAIYYRYYYRSVETRFSILIEAKNDGTVSLVKENFWE